MATKVTITNNPATTVSVRLAPSSNLSLGNLTDVDVSGSQNNEVLIFNSATNKFVVRTMTIDANTIIDSINGGLF